MPTTVEIFVPLAELPFPSVARSSSGSVSSGGTSLPTTIADHGSGTVGSQACPRPSPHEWRQALIDLAVERAVRAAGLPKDRVRAGRLLRRSLDARKGFPVGFRVQVELEGRSEGPEQLADRRLPVPTPVSGRRRVVVVGSGPAGTFAALRLVKAGVEVVLVEQGKPVQPRRRDLALLTRGQLIEESNYCFGEGGAGTYSDGKLYTRSKDRLAVAETLHTLVEHGAEPDIAVESRPHIGSNRLPEILTSLREHLLRLGVEYRFGEQVQDFLLSERGELKGVRCASGLELTGDAVVLAVGHSSRAIYELCARRGVALIAKSFAIGARIEHPQPLIDQMQYGSAADHPALPAAFYQLTAQATGRGVYSFCMCPGGWIVPTATAQEELCTNGMSLKRRDSPLANAALVVTVEPADYAAWGKSAADPLAGLAFQRAIERAAFIAGGGGFIAPGQRLLDFVAGRPSTSLARSTYRPGVRPGSLHCILPSFVTVALQAGVRRFERMMPGFLGAEAQLCGVETRTSSPVRILRGADFMSPTLAGLVPIGEGAGYAGGIVSAAIDGLRAADALIARWS